MSSSIESLYNLGNRYLEEGRCDDAEDAFRSVIAARPEWSYPLNSLGVALLKQTRLAEAATAFERACTLSPHWHLSHFNLALAHIGLGEDRIAEGALRRAIREEPTFSEAHLNLALVLLRQGNFQEGFQEYEWRFGCGGMPAQRSGRPQPLWNEKAGSHETLLLCAEQGAGDLIQFLRFAEPVAQMGFRVFVECPESMQRFLLSCPGVSGVVGAAEPCVEADLQFPLLSVPRVLGLRIEDLPGPIPYLGTQAGDLSAIDAAIEDISGFKIGIVWTGSQKNPRNVERSLSPETFAPLTCIPGVELFSLQHRDGEILPDQLELMGIHSLGSALTDFASEAAAIERMDLVVTVDTSIAHVAGALGRPVWNLLHDRADWRWMTDVLSTPWYPSMRLLRQKKAGDWAEVMQRVEDDLRTQVPPRE